MSGWWSAFTSSYMYYCYYKIKLFSTHKKSNFLNISFLRTKLIAVVISHRKIIFKIRYVFCTKEKKVLETFSVFCFLIKDNGFNMVPA